MEKIELTSEQKKLIKSYMPRFKKYTEGVQFPNDQDERAKRIDYFQIELRKKLPDISESEIEELVVKLWASQMWGNKLYFAQKVIADNGIEKLRNELSRLLDISIPISDRYDHFLKEIKGLGPASLTEMMCYIQPECCGIWNKKARLAIKILKLDFFVNPDKYRISAQEYQKFNNVLLAIAEVSREESYKSADLLFVDFYLYETGQVTAPIQDDAKTFDHDEMKDLIQNIGVMLGFDSETEIPVGHGAKVDVIWRARIGNLGLVTYVFEVHKSGSIDSLLLNLQKSKSSPTVQKVIAVSDEAQLEKIKKESEGLPEEFRRSLGFWKVIEIQEVAESLQSAMEKINQLGLVQGAF